MSVWNDILTSVNTLVDAATTTTVVTRKSGETLVGDTFPMWLICAAGEERPDESAFTNLVRYIYPVAVLYISKHDRSFSLNTTVLTERETIRDTLDRRLLTGASTVMDCDLTPLPITTYREADNTTYDVTGFGVDYVSWETRVN